MLPNKYIALAGNQAWSLIHRHGHDRGRAIELAIQLEIPDRTWGALHPPDRVAAIDAIIARYHARARLEISQRRRLEADREAMRNPRRPRLARALAIPDPLPVRPFTGDRAARDASRSVREARPRWRYRPGPVVRLWMVAYLFLCIGRLPADRRRKVKGASPALFRALLLTAIITDEEE